MGSTQIFSLSAAVGLDFELAGGSAEAKASHTYSVHRAYIIVLVTRGQWVSFR